MCQIVGIVPSALTRGSGARLIQPTAEPTVTHAHKPMTGLNVLIEATRAWATLALLGTGMVAIGAADAGSGVEGWVLLSPVRGGAQREGAAGTAAFGDVELQLVSQAGAVVTAVRSSAAGQYRLLAPPGLYRVKVMTANKITRCPSHEAVVKPGTYTRLDIDCDSGMR